MGSTGSVGSTRSAGSGQSTESGNAPAGLQPSGSHHDTASKVQQPSSFLLSGGALPSLDFCSCFADVGSRRPLLLTEGTWTPALSPISLQEPSHQVLVETAHACGAPVSEALNPEGLHLSLQVDLAAPR